MVREQQTCPHGGNGALGQAWSSAAPEARPGEWGSSRDGVRVGCVGAMARPDGVPAGSAARGGTSLQPPEGVRPPTWFSAGRGLLSAFGEASGTAAILCSRPQTQLGNLQSGGVDGARGGSRALGGPSPHCVAPSLPGPFGPHNVIETESSRREHVLKCAV